MSTQEFCPRCGGATSGGPLGLSYCECEDTPGPTSADCTCRAITCATCCARALEEMRTMAGELAVALRKVLDTAVWDDEFCSKEDYVAATEPAEAVLERAQALGVAS